LEYTVGKQNEKHTLEREELESLKNQLYEKHKKENIELDDLVNNFNKRKKLLK